MILAERNARVMAEANAAVVKAEAANAQAELSSSEALNAHLKLEIEKLRRELYGSRSERKARLLEQMELQLEDLETAATEDELAGETAAARTRTVQSFQRKRPSRKPFPDHLPRERIVIAAPELSLLWFGEAVEARRGHHRDAGGDPAAVEGDPDGAGKVLVPGMREDHATAGTLPRDAAWLCRAEPAGHDPV
jgi:multidrug efflux pump subunit AcrA (membrane-fusion protein)